MRAAFSSVGLCFVFSNMARVLIGFHSLGGLRGFVAPHQAGGRFDATLMAIGILVALQIRRNLGLRTYLEKLDLHQGYDLAL